MCNIITFTLRRQIRFVEVNNESSYDGTIYAVKEGISTPYTVGLSPAHKCLRWDLKEVKGLHNGDEVSCISTFSELFLMLRTGSCQNRQRSGFGY